MQNILFLVAFFPLLAHSALAATAGQNTTVVLADQQIDPAEDVDLVRFNADEKLANAWVDVDLYSTLSPDDGHDLMQITAPGLTYNPTTRNLSYTDGTRTTICSVMKGPDITVWVDHLVDTGNCVLNAKTYTQTVNNGTDGYDANMLHVEMDVSF